MDAHSLAPHAANTSRDQDTVIGPKALFKGELTFEGCGRIYGALEGSIRASGEVEVAAGGSIQATVEADIITVGGLVQGDLIARDQVELTSRANLQGDVTAAALVVAKGATFVGRCTVGPDALGTLPRERAPAGTTEAKPKPTSRHAPQPPHPSRATSEWLSEPIAVPTPGDWMNQPTPARTA